MSELRPHSFLEVASRSDSPTDSADLVREYFIPPGRYVVGQVILFSLAVIVGVAALSLEFGFAMFGALFASLGLALAGANSIAECRRGRVVLSHDGIECRTFWTSRTVTWSDLTRVNWMSISGVSLETESTRLEIELLAYPPELRWMLAYFIKSRAVLTEERHWPRYLQAMLRLPTIAESDVVYWPRSRWSWIFGSGLGFAVIILAGMKSYFELPPERVALMSVAVVGLLGVLWATLFFSTPTEGNRTRRPSESDRRSLRQMAMILLSLVVGLPVIGLTVPQTVRGWILFPFLTVLLLAEIAVLRREERRVKPIRVEQQEQACREWTEWFENTRPSSGTHRPPPARTSGSTDA